MIKLLAMMALTCLSLNCLGSDWRVVGEGDEYLSCIDFSSLKKDDLPDTKQLWQKTIFYGKTREFNKKTFLLSINCKNKTASVISYLNYDANNKISEGYIKKYKSNHAPIVPDTNFDKAYENACSTKYKPDTLNQCQKFELIADYLIRDNNLSLLDDPSDALINIYRYTTTNNLNIKEAFEKYITPLREKKEAEFNKKKEELKHSSVGND